MQIINEILSDAIDVLTNKENLTHIKSRHVVDRRYSAIYELCGKRAGFQYLYILKISTTDRTCENEYNQYQLLNSKGINALVPIAFSSKYNYLITKKEVLIEFDRYLKQQRDVKIQGEMFFELGKLFKRLESVTGSSGTFCSNEYQEFVFPRLNKINSFSPIKKKMIERKLTSSTNSRNGENIMFCLVSDFSLGNIHINDQGEFVLVDMGDASTSYIYDNIAYIFLNIKYGPLNQYLTNNTKTKYLFSRYLEGYERHTIDQSMFKLFEIKHLILMISFLSRQKTSSSGRVRSFLSAASDKFLISRYKRNIFQLLEEM